MSGTRPGPLGAHEHSHHARHVAHHAHHAHHGTHQHHPPGRHPLGQQTRLQPSDLFRDKSLREYVEMHSLPGGLTPATLHEAMIGVREATANKWAGPLSVACGKYGITRSLRRIAAFLGHIAVESGSLHFPEERLSYKTAHLINHYFKNIKTDEEAEQFTRKPKELANKVYANRNGNGDEASGDGWRYRGRGLIHLTGKANYAAFAEEIGVDVVKDPDLVATPQYAALSAASYWKHRGLNSLADAEMYEALSLKINSSLDGFPQREAGRVRALDVLCRALISDITLSAGRGGFGSHF